MFARTLEVSVMTSTNVRVTIGDDPVWTFTAASVDDETWNGWECPWFTESEARKIAAVSKAAYERDPDLTQEYVDVREDASPAERFVMLAPEENGDEAYPEASVNVDGVWVYGIGAGNWTWEIARP